MIQVQNLKKTYGTITAVDDISFEVQKGDIIGFLGPNGAGKTTTMKILTCFLGATSGTASIGGFDVEKDSFEVRKRIGYLPENAPLYTDLDVLSFLRFIAEIRQIDTAKFASKIDEIIITCGLKSVLRRPISQLSKGFRQRVGLAQAMIHDPDVLILDEPTSGLDPNQIIEIRELIKRIGREKTVILSTHILPEVSATCSRAIIINRGKIIAQGTLDELSSMSKEYVYAKIRGDRSQIEEKLRSFGGAQSVEATGESDGFTMFKLHPVSGRRIAEDVFKLAVANGWSMSELKAEGASLEEVFTQLTRSGQ
ncbi:MAG: ABC transporter [Candidatus Raymondbacteria bacterium RifOxyA12_full_50_37]|uniref:ABC transporter n=1 Tax=Candidatus Raymondbacteria bacterium RIFOXYD12_FULL_49_13 TaxID=1817890 RepID=A0A1F7F8D4_UNCRA|nr:MAG: ABC transporter [Candidatus Raymondbacteria bacterium RifOxyA12_full_50_37]OGJ91330.1 MAG: ABC transporter [Candidatus Raymondbacteria bacterium RIFOXYA2_FULL_49_16]OGJ94422.1 MAG: ABC transporter [Candidatus Raymondbacteria bacterium RifOxyB12_full_50_8]OGJ97765.1 MAG: ABC transporter [Candidatus Raymondbacteria bacterium RIFOXYC2_FULL_50_21]OGK02924.1 MAG: ABC transporter [Candidatus Raymondbacteria bacterium RIFOXYD12_FULL_49_13]OGK05736.1 MAG: ABC transporter [Candidatus Raymondbac